MRGESTVTSLNLLQSSGIHIEGRLLRLLLSKLLSVNRSFLRYLISTLSNRTRIEKGKTEVEVESATTVIIDVDHLLLHLQEREGSTTRKTRGVGVDQMIRRRSIMMKNTIIRRDDD